MGEGRHIRKRRFARVTVVAGVATFLVVALAGASFAGYRYEQARMARILPGIRIAGVDVGGMTEAQALQALAGRAEAILRRPVQITVGGRSWSLTAQSLGTSVDVRTPVQQALALSGEYGWPSRLYHRLLNKPIHRSFDLVVRHDDTFVTAFVGKIAAEVHRVPTNAYLDFADGRLVTRHAHAGLALQSRAARDLISTAVRQGTGTVALGTRRIAPKVTDKALGQTIVVRISENRLFLYDGLKLEHSYSVATGQLGVFPTPQGHFEIVNKRINPTWVNPALDSWGKDEPAMIPPGPDNPLGTRALDLSAPGIRIHGTPDDGSIGHWASHGCIRMHIPDSEQLFDLVGVGTPVIIAW